VKKITKNTKKRLKKKLKKAEGNKVDSDKEQTSLATSPTEVSQSAATNSIDDVNDLSDIIQFTQCYHVFMLTLYCSVHHM